MDYFPYHLIDYANMQTPPISIDFNEFKGITSSIAIEQMNFSYWTPSPWRENYHLGLVIRNQDFTILNDPGGLIDTTLFFFNSLTGSSISETYDVIGVEINAEGQGFQENYFYALFKIEIVVKNKHKL